MDLNNECITRTPNCGQGFNNRADHWTDGSGHSKTGLLLASLYDAGQYAERVAMKLDFVATALRRQFISYDSATSWLSDLGLLDYVLRAEFSYEAVR
jgi:hypothetical protein